MQSFHVLSCFCVQREDGIRALVRSLGLGDVYQRQVCRRAFTSLDYFDPFEAFVGQTSFALTPIWTARRPYLWQEPCARVQIRFFEDTWVALVSTPAALLLAAIQVRPPACPARRVLATALPDLSRPARLLLRLPWSGPQHQDLPQHGA